MTDELIAQYYNKKLDKGNCWYTDVDCPLKEHCNGLQRPKCREYATTEDHHTIIDTMIEWYHKVDEDIFLESYDSAIAYYHRS